MALFDFLRAKKKPAQTHRTGGKGVSTRRYRAPAVGTSEGGWFPRGGVERVPSALPLIRARARDLAENSPYGAAAVRTIVGHAIGSGLRLGIANDDDYRRSFSTWASSTDCDFSGQQNFYALQSTALSTMGSAGDCLIVLHQKRVNGGLMPQLQLFDPEHFDEGAAPKYDGNEVRAGVEVTATGQVVGYHIRRSLDSTLVGSWETQFIYADQAILLFERLYPGQLRGIPRGAQALEKLHQADAFLNAAIAKARTEACLMAFMTVPSSEDGSGALLGELDPLEDDKITTPEVLEPGAFIPLPPGRDVKMVTPSSSGGMRDYLQKTIEAIAVAYGCTYAQISGDVTGANYSSSKLSIIEFARGIDVLQSHVLIPAVLRIERAFRLAYEATHDRDVTAPVRVIKPARESVEPDKEIKAELDELGNGLALLEDSWMSRGRDPDEMWTALEAQAARLKKLGMPVAFAAGLATAPADPPADPPDC